MAFKIAFSRSAERSFEQDLSSPDRIWSHRVQHHDHGRTCALFLRDGGHMRQCCRFPASTFMLRSTHPKRGVSPPPFGVAFCCNAVAACDQLLRIDWHGKPPKRLKPEKRTGLRHCSRLRLRRLILSLLNKDFGVFTITANGSSLDGNGPGIALNRPAGSQRHSDVTDRSGHFASRHAHRRP